jgi:hypothetical protein
MADNVELRIVLVDQDGVGTPTPASQSQPGNLPPTSSYSIAQSPFVQPVGPASVTTPPQQPITVQAQTVSVAANSATATVPQQPQTFAFAAPPVNPATSSHGQPSVGADSKETSSIFNFQTQKIDASARQTSDTYSFQKPPEPATAKAKKEPKKELTVREEAKAILAKRQRDKQVQSELEKLDPPKPKSFSTKAFSTAARVASSAGLRKTAQTLGNASQAAAQGEMGVAGGAAIAALAIGQAVLEGFTNAARAAKASIEELSYATTLLARGQNFGALMTVTDSAVKAVGAIPVIGGALEAGLGVATTAVRGFANVVQGFVDRGAELAKYSPEISQARSMAEIRQMQGDIREAQALGPSIARLTEIQSEASDALREILLPIKQILIDEIAGILKEITEYLRENGPTIAAVLVEILGTLQILLERITFQGDRADEHEKTLPDRAARAYLAVKNSSKPPDVNAAEDLLEKLKNAAFFQFVGARNAMPKRRQQPAKPAFVFGGGVF